MIDSFPCRAFVLTAAAAFCLPLARGDVSAHWLDDKAPALTSGVSFGVPFKKGEMPKTQAFSLSGADGTSLPVQS